MRIKPRYRHKSYSDTDRKHRCDHCRRIFVCEPCSAAMDKANANSNYPLYSEQHFPRARGGSINPWLCEECK